MKYPKWGDKPYLSPSSYPMHSVRIFDSQFDHEVQIKSLAVDSHYSGETKIHVEVPSLSELGAKLSPYPFNLDSKIIVLEPGQNLIVISPGVPIHVPSHTKYEIL